MGGRTQAEIAAKRPKPHGRGARKVSAPIPAKGYLNLVGPQVRRLRYQKGWSQNNLAIRLQLAGLDKDRSGVGKIESRLVHVSDFELLYLREVLEVELTDLYPTSNDLRKAKDFVPVMMQLQF